ncbi:MAG: transcriptional repressor LexA [Candidatus Sericytochromatia bacterium]|nr:transcriptional repressor LexA [Candidatus Sericytochromatia bacterium]
MTHPPDHELPERQAQILLLLRQWRAEKGYVPSIREIGLATGLRSTSTIHYHLTSLAARGLIEWEKGRNRAIRIVGDEPAERPASVLPLAGRIAAGRPIEAIEDQDEVDLAGLWPQDQVYLLEVKGESMIEDHITPGDWVVVRKQHTAREGEIVVALLEDGEATLKRLYKHPGGYRLQPANAAMEPILVTDVTIQGKVVGLIRRV